MTFLIIIGFIYLLAGQTLEPSKATELPTYNSNDFPSYIPSETSEIGTNICIYKMILIGAYFLFVLWSSWYYYHYLSPYKAT